MASGLRMNSGDSGRSKSGLPPTTSAPGRHTKLRPNMSGSSVFSNAAPRQSGTPAATRRSQACANSAIGVGADRAPSISQSVSFLSSAASMTEPLADQVPAPSREDRGFAASFSDQAIAGPLCIELKDCFDALAPDDIKQHQR